MPENKEEQEMTEQQIPAKLRNIIDGTAGFNQYFDMPKEQLDAIAALGFRFYEQGKIRDAETIFEGLIVMDPKLHYGHAGLGAMALRDEKLDEAVRHLGRATELNPQDATVHANLGEALLRQANFTDAASQFERAMELDPQERDPGANRARAILQGMNLVVSEMQRVGVA
jgi:Flp pilus assembly protein TadD